MKKMRADLLLLERKMVESRAKAQRIIMAGQLRANNQVVPKPASLLPPDCELVIDTGPRFVSRGGEKLAGALAAFGLDITGRVCADVGSSTGGFTDCLLQNGVARVFSIDVGNGLLHWKIRQDNRVIVMEETNARYQTTLPEQVTLVTVDVSFISLKILLPVIRGWLAPIWSGDEITGSADREFGLYADVIVLVKPQFEAGRKAADKGAGVIRDPKIHRAVLEDVGAAAESMGFTLLGLGESSPKGPKGI